MDTFASSWYFSDSFDTVNGCVNNFIIMILLMFIGLYAGVLVQAVQSLAWFSQIIAWKSQSTLLQSTSTSTSGSSSSSTSGSNHSDTPLDWWKDLAPPFSLVDDDDDDDDEHDRSYPPTMTENDDDNDSPEDCSENSELDIYPKKISTVTHFCFLVHGHRGYSRDLSYLQHKMERVAKKKKKEQKRERWKQIRSNTSATEHDATCIPECVVHELVVHAVVCNEKKTDDGVVNGGERLVEEMISTIREEMRKKRSPVSNGKTLQNVTISMIGNSLGGIYARYAIAKLNEKCELSNNTSYNFVLDGQYALYFNVFCTTATPHLGIAGHTFLPIPRTAEIGVAHALGDTGRDLFRLNDLLKRMATTPEFLQPLRSFRKRIAYANAYATDFPVPVRTAAFLSESSTYPHHFVMDDKHKDDKVVVDDSGFVIATLHTPAQQLNVSSEEDSFYPTNESEKNDHDLVVMSRSLDSLGWKKVFIDVRNVIPSIPLPSFPTAFTRKSKKASSDDSDLGDTESDDVDNINSMNERRVDPVNILKQKGNIVSSRDVAAALSTHPLFGDEILRWPRGHNMIVAFSRDPLSTYLNKAGRPVVNALASELVDTIFGWNQTELSEQIKPQDDKCC